MADKSHEQSIADKVKAANEARKTTKSDVVEKQPNFTRKALATWQDPTTQQYYLLILDLDGETGETRLVERRHALGGLLEVREMFKIAAMQLGVL